MYIKCSNFNDLCRNGGTCIDAPPTGSVKDIIGFKCQCPDGWSGDYCEKKEPCKPNPCPSGTSCIPIASFYYCASAAVASDNTTKAAIETLTNETAARETKETIATFLIIINFYFNYFLN